MQDVRCNMHAPIQCECVAVTEHSPYLTLPCRRPTVTSRTCILRPLNLLSDRSQSSTTDELHVHACVFHLAYLKSYVSYFLSSQIWTSDELDVEHPDFINVGWVSIVSTVTGVSLALFTVPPHPRLLISPTLGNRPTHVLPILGPRS